MATLTLSRRHAALDQRRDDAQRARGLVVAVGALHDRGGEHEGRQRLFSRHHGFHDLAAHQRVVDQAFAEGEAVFRHRHGLVQAAAHHRRRAHAVRQAAQVDHVEHVLEAHVLLAQQRYGFGTVEGDLAGRHGFRAELRLQAHDAVAVARAVLQGARHGEQRQAAGAGLGACADAPAA